MTVSATLVLANHRPEIIPLARQLMAVHDTILLEEPPEKCFDPMLDGKISIDTYLEDQDLEYPEFSHKMARVLRERHRAGSRLVQIEPFIEVLLSIHDRFANGEGPQDLPAGTEMYRVYRAEHLATKALIDFYRASGRDDFDATLDAVKRFAKADAQRFALRDQMRAEAMVALVQNSGKVYIEAGQIHYPLWLELKRRLPAGFPLQVHFLMTAVVRRLGYHRHLFGPGDLLTLYYRFHPRDRFDNEDLFAARALIYNKLILKEEIAADADTYPHTRDELEVGSVTDQLSLDDCRRLYPLVRRASTPTSREIVAGYLGLRRGRG
ncbi:hypothetical protein [Desulfatitalea alkaliphila]|uniref:Uncharacterized protein n=1 Tax=Desulfatitalea alkaliphila TaxID=2929485 RepID=A0AA41UQN7_9BACT|nr:hypothetical protein [Desulfatitalea alkaliphila]MCJ8501553.1 hypothetical protein [Desulfatitalea alkaliphila]